MPYPHTNRTTAMSLPTPPVLLIVFNRPLQTRRTFEAIRQARPERFYVAADGPRPNTPNDQSLCSEVRKIVMDIDWECYSHTLFRSDNLGCRDAVSSAISWFFKHEPEGIILEDDCLPHQTFFPYCSELLEKFRDDKRVAAISGDGALSASGIVNSSYTFSRYPLVWGWATWRRAWALYESDMSSWSSVRETDWLEVFLGGDRTMAQYRAALFDSVKSRSLDTWDAIWLYSCWRNDMVAALPKYNIVKNIGFGTDATHTRQHSNWRSDLPLQAMPFPLDHPETRERNPLADDWLDRTIYRSGKRSPFVMRLLSRIARPLRAAMWPIAVSRRRSPGDRS